MTNSQATEDLVISNSDCANGNMTAVPPMWIELHNPKIQTRSICFEPYERDKGQTLIIDSN